MAEKFIKENDYTLTVERTEEQERSAYHEQAKPHLVSSIRRTFNFLSAQITTATRDWAYQNVYNSEGGASSAVSTTTLVQNFNDVQSNAEIKMMHAKLVGMGGTPPSLEEIFPNEMHKKSTLSGGLGHG